MPGAVKLKELPQFDGAMDFYAIESFIFFVDNYFALVNLTDPIQQTRFVSTLLIKQAALWLQTNNFDLSWMAWGTLKLELRSYFRPADYRRRTRNKLVNMRQMGKVSGYINAFKRVCAKISNIFNEEMLDCFIPGLQVDN